MKESTQTLVSVVAELMRKFELISGDPGPTLRISQVSGKQWNVALGHKMGTGATLEEGVAALEAAIELEIVRLRPRPAGLVTNATDAPRFAFLLPDGRRVVGRVWALGAFVGTMSTLLAAPTEGLMWHPKPGCVALYLDSGECEVVPLIALVGMAKEAPPEERPPRLYPSDRAARRTT